MPTLPNTHFVPTEKNFGIPTAGTFPNPTLLQKEGILLHDPIGQRWMINGMPLLRQDDPAIDTPLDGLFATIPESQFPQKTGSDGQPLFTPSGRPVRLTRTEFRNFHKANGCYNASMVTVIVTALLNRAPSLKNSLTNRTKFFNEIKSVNGTPQLINQLAWQYFQEAQGQMGLLNPNGKSIIQPLYFHEVVADFGNGKIQEKCDPYFWGSCTKASLPTNDAFAFRNTTPTPKDLSNEFVIQLMLEGAIPMIAYQRYIPVHHTRPAGSNDPTYTFSFTGRHKVVFNGFQSGSKFPLRIFDVGNGQAYNVRIASNLHELTFDFTNKNPSTPDFPATLENALFLIYEGEEKKTNPTVLFIDHFDYLKIRHAEKVITPPILKDKVVIEPLRKPINIINHL